jgi:hypothetical protein
MVSGSLRVINSKISSVFRAVVIFLVTSINKSKYDALHAAGSMLTLYLPSIGCVCWSRIENDKF